MKKVVDSSAFKAAMQDYKAEVEAIIEKQNRKAASDLESMMKRLAPRGETGKLDSSIITESVEGGYVVAAAGWPTVRKKTAGKRTYTLRSSRKVRKHGTDYGKVQEYGSKTMNIRARPFINPSRSKVRRAYNKRIKSAINRLAKKVSGKGK